MRAVSISDVVSNLLGASVAPGSPQFSSRSGTRLWNSSPIASMNHSCVPAKTLSSTLFSDADLLNPIDASG
ncbi:hypothetical protein SS05631_a45600 (plasmid) [Sinorhizobium sp. CCBAU 05631]|nr:hypothetical protein SS05631_a45600 [Sinorhizobium sp. CCBAU 05631]